jgi:hypothetical protein
LLTCYSIVAIHGLGADPDHTWRGRDENKKHVNWLTQPDMLPKAVPDARIMRFGYKSDWFGKFEAKMTFVDNVAQRLLEDLKELRVVQRRFTLQIFSY